MAQIKVSDLTFCYEGSYDNIFEHVNFQIDTDWKLGFIGRNGRGKTTFLNLLRGNYEYEGSISAGMEFEYFPYEVKKREQNTIEVLEDLEPGYELWKICRELSLLEVDAEVLYRSFSTLSKGEQTKVLLALLFSKDEKFLLIDEPTDHLDMEGRQKVAEYLSRKQSYLLVSHDREFLDGCTDHVLVLERQNIVVMQGNFTSWWEQKQKRDAFELAENRKLLQDISRLRAAAERTEGWSEAVEQTKYGSRNSGLRPDRGFIGRKSAKMMKRAKAVKTRVDTALEERSKLLKNLERTDDLKLFPLQYHKEKLLRAEKLCLWYGDKQVFQALSFELRSGEQIALAGRNGCGKSSVIKRIAGEEIVQTGSLTLGSGLILSYVPQDVGELKGSLREYAKRRNLPEHLLLALLRKLDFPRVQFEKDMSCYSQGQKKKVALAASLLSPAHLYLWDEPLNYIDVFSRMQIADLIRTYRPTLLLVEHDRRFLEEIGAEIVEVRRLKN